MFVGDDILSSFPLPTPCAPLVSVPSMSITPSCGSFIVTLHDSEDESSDFTQDPQNMGTGAGKRGG